MKYVNPDGVPAFLSSSPKALLLLGDRDDPLCQEALMDLSYRLSRLEASGVAALAVDVSSEASPGCDELSCVRVPQIRLILHGKLKNKVVGVHGIQSLLLKISEVCAC